MEPTIQVRWWNYQYGTEYMARWEENRWDFADREYGAAQWYPVDATPELRETANSLLTAEQKNRIQETAKAQAHGTEADSHHRDELVFTAAT